MSELTKRIEGTPPFNEETNKELLLELSRAHDETRRRMEAVEKRTRRMECDEGRKVNQLTRQLGEACCFTNDVNQKLERHIAGKIEHPPQPTSPTLTGRLVESLSNLAGCADDLPPERQWMIEQANAVLDANRSAQPHAVPADVLASMDILEDEASAEPCNEHGRDLNAAMQRVCRYVRDLASPAVGGKP